MAKGLNIGGGWLKTHGDKESISLSFNEEVFNINPTQCWVSLYPNERKAKPTQPDFNIVATPKEAKVQIKGTMPSKFPRPQNFAPQSSKPKITPRVQPTDLDNALDGPPADLWTRADGDPEF